MKSCLDDLGKHQTPKHYFMHSTGVLPTAAVFAVFIAASLPLGLAIVAVACRSDASASAVAVASTAVAAGFTIPIAAFAAIMGVHAAASLHAAPTIVAAAAANMTPQCT
jgi:hypothetical protein